MPSVVTITPRLIYLEDLSTTVAQAGALANVNVLQADGSSSAEVLNKIPMVQYTHFTAAAGDVAAAAAGVAVGEIFYCTTDSKLHARLT